MKNDWWDTPWFLNTYDRINHIKRDVRFGKTGDSYRWIELKCNDNDCDAKMVLRIGTIETMAQKLLETQK